MDCLVCRSNAGVERISPGQPVYDGKYWIVEHAYPSALLGWLVIVLKRHAEALHVLSREEGAELGLLQRAVAIALQEKTGCTKEYSVLFAEQPSFGHLHFHMVPRAGDLNPDRLGGKVFAYLKPEPSDVVPEEQVAAFCRTVGQTVKLHVGE